MKKYHAGVSTYNNLRAISRRVLICMNIVETFLQFTKNAHSHFFLRGAPASSFTLCLADCFNRIARSMGRKYLFLVPSLMRVGREKGSGLSLRHPQGAVSRPGAGLILVACSSCFVVVSERPGFLSWFCVSCPFIVSWGCGCVCLFTLLLSTRYISWYMPTCTFFLNLKFFACAEKF